MKQFLARLNPSERRFVVGVIVLFFVVINFVWVWPHFKDWGETKDRMKTATDKLLLFEGGTNLIPGLQAEIRKFQQSGEVVPQADQAVHFVRVIQSEAAKCGIVPESMGSQRGVTNNPFFMEQAETMTMQTSEKQLVDFLYNLGAGTSLIRVKVLSTQPDPSHQRLTAHVTLVASYQRKAVGETPAAPSKPAATPAKPATAPAPQKAGAPNAATNAARPRPSVAPANLTPTKK